MTRHRLPLPMVPRLSRGFSLVEMLVAMAALAVALGALYQAASGATRNARLATDYAAATTMAESMLDELMARRLPIGASSSEQLGIFDGQGWVEPVIGREDAGIAWMHVAVRWQDGARERSVHLQSVGRSQGAENGSI